jgi:hypothetical protein
MNIRLIELSKRAAEIIQEREQAINYLNINAALNDAAREFKNKERKDNEIFIYDNYGR